MALAYPANSAPMAAPGIDPRPPITTTAKARMMTSAPMPGVTEILGAVTTPPITAKTVPMAKVVAKMRVTLIPMAALISRSATTAVVIRPIRERSSQNHRAIPSTMARATIIRS